MITLKGFIRQNRPIDIAPENCFDVTLADFELFSQGVKQI